MGDSGADLTGSLTAVSRAQGRLYYADEGTSVECGVNSSLALEIICTDVRMGQEVEFIQEEGNCLRCWTNRNYFANWYSQVDGTILGLKLFK